MYPFDVLDKYRFNNTALDVNQRTGPYKLRTLYFGFGLPLAVM